MKNISIFTATISAAALIALLSTPSDTKMITAVIRDQVGSAAVASIAVSTGVADIPYRVENYFFFKNTVNNFTGAVVARGFFFNVFIL